MGSIIKLLLVIVITGVVVFGFYMYQNELNPFSLDDIKKATSSTQSKIEKISDVIKDTNDISKESVVYKRKNANGNWYYSNEPPKEGEEAETVIYRSDTNVVPPLPDDNKRR